MTGRARTDAVDIYARIAARLSCLVEDDTFPPHPYLCRHLVEYAASGNALNDATISDSFLKWETSGTIRAHLGVPLRQSDDNAGLRAWAAIEPHLGDASPLSRAISHQFAKVALGAESTAGLPLRTRWAHWRIVPNILAKLDTSVRSVAPLADIEGRALLAMGCDDGAVRIWDPVTGRQVGDPLVGHTGPVVAVASFTDAEGRVLLATGGDRTVRIWDPVTGGQVGDPLVGHTDWVWAVASFTDGQGRVLLATGGDRTVRIWDPVTGRQVGDPLVGHTDWVWAVASFTDGQGRVLLATGGGDRTVRIWDPVTGGQVGDPLVGHTDWVWAVASFTDGQGRVLLATASDDTTVRVWDPAGRYEVTRLVTGSPIVSLVYGRDPLAPFLVLGGSSGELALVDLALEDVPNVFGS